METECNFRVCFTCELDASDRRQIIELCESSHGTDFQRLFEFIDDGLHVIAAKDGRMLGHAVRTTRWAQPEGYADPLKTAYIDAVSTAVEEQGKGIGSAVMRRLAAAVAQEDYQLCALETDKPGFYTRLGWEVWQGELAGRRAGGLVPTPEAQGNVMILRLPGGAALDVTSLLTIEDQGRFW